jgi:hypothetical protein
MSCAPIALFAYRRLEHLQQTVASLQADPLAQRTDLWVFSDGPRQPEHAADVEAVRRYLHTVTGFASIHILEREENFGLARAIIAGVTQLCQSHGRVIVVEDDLVVAPFFLQYMNGALDRYRDEDKVMAVSAYMYPVRDPEALPKLFFCRVPTSWGWATWARAWAWFQPDAEVLAAQLLQSGQRKAFDMDDNYPYFESLQSQARGELDVWGVRWYASVFLHNGLCLYPSHALVHNAGMDGSGVHCGVSSAYEVDVGRATIAPYPDLIAENKAAVAQIVQFFRTLREPMPKRLLRRVLRRFAQPRPRA